MPSVLNEYVGDGVSTSFNIAMEDGYLSRDYVKFYVRPADALLDWTPLTNNTVTWTGAFSFTIANAIPVGSVLVVFRETPLAPLVDFQNTSRVTEKNLDTGITQPLHKVAELSDTVERSTEVVLGAQADAKDALARVAVAEAAAVGAATAAVEARDFAEAADNKATSADAFAQAADARATQAALDAAAAAAASVTAVNVSGSAMTTANTAASEASTALNTANTALDASAAATSTANTALSQAGSAVDTADSAAADAAHAVSVAEDANATAADALSRITEVVEGNVQSWNGRTGFVIPQAGDYTPDMVSLGNVDNTADADKPLSTAAIDALAAKADAATAATKDELAAKADAATAATKDELAALEVKVNSYATVPTTRVADVITVTTPHLRVMVWNGTKYIRAPWHAPGHLSYFLRNVPAGYVEVRSDVVLNKADFPDLAEYLGVAAATFTLDETRGEFLRTLDSGRGIDSGRAVGSWQDSDNKSHTHTGSAASAGAHTHTVSGTAASGGAHTHSMTAKGDGTSAGTLGNGGHQNNGTVTIPSDGAHTHTVSGTAASAGAHTHTVTVTASGGTESRPRNRAYRLAVQY